MALKKQITDPAGVDHPEAYWKIKSYTDDPIAKKFSASVVVYHDEGSKTAGKTDIFYDKTIQYVWQGVEYDKYFSENLLQQFSPRSQIYKAIHEYKRIINNNQVESDYLNDAIDV